MLQILPLQNDSAVLAAHAHITYLRSPLQSAGGYGMLVAQYQAVAGQAGATGFVAWVDGQFAGFICGVWDRRALQKKLLASAPRLVWYTLQQIAAHPSYFVYRLARRFSYARQAENMYHGYELRPIVVLPEFRGQGVADCLVDRLLEDARARGFAQVYLFTEQDNHAAARFYVRYGFRLQNEVELHAGTPYAVVAKHFVYDLV